MQAIHLFLDGHYRHTLDEPLPVLGGKTLRQAVTTNKGREQAVDWLKQLENIEHRRAADQGHKAYGHGLDLAGVRYRTAPLSSGVFCRVGLFRVRGQAMRPAADVDAMSYLRAHQRPARVVGRAGRNAGSALRRSKLGTRPGAGEPTGFEQCGGQCPVRRRFRCAWAFCQGQSLLAPPRLQSSGRQLRNS